MNNVNLKQGDCIEIIKDIADRSIDCIITSPPYDNLRNYKNTLSWNFDTFKNVAKELFRVLKEGGVIIWVVADATIKGSESGTSFKQALYFKELGLNIHDTMIYRKVNYMPLTHNRYEQEFEYMFVFSKGKPKTFNPIKIPCKHAGKNFVNTHYKTSDDKLTKTEYTTKDYKIKGNIFEYSVGGTSTGKYKHPAMFPIGLVKDQLLSWTNECDIVLDPFMGSGTTGVVCKELNREFVGIEIVEEYFNIAKERINS